MFCKLSVSNVKKSIQDYAIYFLTLTVAVCIFYVFNSIDAQKNVLTGSAVSESFLSNMDFSMSLLSVFVTIVVAGLVLYANNFLVGRRKREFGIYMTLGMSKLRISGILLLETLLVGSIALGAGLVLGFVLSQGMALFSSYLLNIEIVQFQLVFSAKAVGKTVLCFGLVFVVVMLCNHIMIARYQLSQLLCAAKKNQSIKVKNPTLLVGFLILSVLILASGYALVLAVGMNPLNPLFLAAIVIGAVGTFLFVYSLSGALLFFMSRNRKVYYKGLNIFVLRQLNNKIVTNFVSISMISFLLFLAISISLSMFTYRSNLERMLDGNLNFDASGTVSIYNQEDREKDLRALINQNQAGIVLDDKTQFALYKRRSVDTSMSEILADYLSARQKEEIQKSVYGASNIAGKTNVLTSSEYNQIRGLLGEEPIPLADQEILVVSNYDDGGVLTDYIHDVGTVQLAGVTYRIKNDAPIVENIMTGSSVSYFYLIVPDSFTDFRDAPEEQRINFVCTGNDAERAEQKAVLTKLLEYYETLSRNGQATVEPIAIYGVTNDQFQANIYGSTASLIFIGIYLGLIFLIASVAILAIQQLSEASESIGRYCALQKMGVPDNLIRQSVLQQILFYFALPLGLAIVDSAFGIRVMGERFNQFHLSIFNGVSLIAMIIFAFIFSGYLYVTYKGYQNVIAKTHSIG